jgi:hypothetical protein
MAAAKYPSPLRTRWVPASADRHQDLRFRLRGTTAIAMVAVSFAPDRESVALDQIGS